MPPNQQTPPIRPPQSPVPPAPSMDPLSSNSNTFQNPSRPTPPASPDFIPQAPLPTIPFQPTSQQQPQAMPGGDPYAYSNPAVKSKRWLIVVPVVIVFIIIIGSYFGIGYINSRPEKVLADAATNTVVATLARKSFSSNTKIIYYQKDADNLKLEAKIDTKTAENNTSNVSDLSVSLGASKFTLKVNAITISDKEIYFKLVNLEKSLTLVAASDPALKDSLNQSLPTIRKLDGQWIKFGGDTLENEGLISQIDSDKCSAAFKNLRISKTDEGTIRKLYSKNPFVSSIADLPSEDILGQSSFHYKINFNQKNLTSFAKEMVALKSFSEIKSECNIQQQDIDDFFADNSAQTDQAQTGKTEFEVWVNKSSRLFTKIKLKQTDTSNPTDFLDFSSEIIQTAKPTTIVAPDNAISLETILDDAFTSSEDPGTQPGPDFEAQPQTYRSLRLDTLLNTNPINIAK